MSASTQAKHEVLVADDKAAHAALAAELMARAIVDAVEARGVARVALSGGSTPSDTYRLLASFDLPFDDVHWYWVDERAVPPDNPRSNYGVASKDLSLADGKHGHGHRMLGEAMRLAAAAEAYERLLRGAFGVASAASFDAMVLGVGDDGHTASLFPGMGTVAIDDRLVVAVEAQPDKGLEPRLTLTAPVICEAKLVLVLARGASKKAVIAAARAEGSEDEMPSRLLQRARGKVVWVLDREAA